MKCPQCHTPLQMAERQGIEIDYCPSCRGVWLDRGELDKIVERSAVYSGGGSGSPDSERGPAERGAAERRREHDSDYRPRKKESFWRELFDFD